MKKMCVLLVMIISGLASACENEHAQTKTTGINSQDKAVQNAKAKAIPKKEKSACEILKTCNTDPKLIRDMKRLGF